MKKTGKTSLLLILALALSLGLAASIWAQPMGKGMGCGPGAANLTPDQASKLFDLKEKMHAETAPLRKQMMVKRAEMAALWKAENPDQNVIQAKQKEMNEVRDQMQQKMTTFRLEAKKIAPDAAFGMGMGHGCGKGMGGGCGMGPGGPGMPPPPPPAK
jgi:Spy/CpxP family protein refolding chaperone